MTPALAMRFGPQQLGCLDQGANREWLVADGLGGYAMGTLSGLRTRRYHGLLVRAGTPPGRRWLGLAALDPVIDYAGATVELGVHEWADGTVAPQGHRWLSNFCLRDGVVPCWRYQIGDCVLERQVATAYGRNTVGVLHRVVAASGPVRLRLEVLANWRDVHGEQRDAAALSQQPVAGGVLLAGELRLRGPGFTPAGWWYRNVTYREEAARGLPAVEDLWFAGWFDATLQPGETAEVEAWTGDLAEPPASAAAMVESRCRRAQALLARTSPADPTAASLTLAADQFITASSEVVAGYPWFGIWGRDAMIAYDGLFLTTGRAEEGRRALSCAGEALSAGMLANTSDSGEPAFNSVDAALWWVHAVDRHVARTGDVDLAAELWPALAEVIAWYVSGTRFGIGVDPRDGLVRQGGAGLALTWMDARVGDEPITARAGKPVEVNALWINALAAVRTLAAVLGRSTDAGSSSLLTRGRSSFDRRFRRGDQLADVVDGPAGDDWRVRPNAVIALSLPRGPGPRAGELIGLSRVLLTPLGLRSLSPADPDYQPYHRGDPASRDRAYHQGTVWPWLIGPYHSAARRAGLPTGGLLDGLAGHLADWGVGSVSETADGEPGHRATGAPFQAWSVAEVLRAWTAEAETRYSPPSRHRDGGPPVSP